MGTKQEFEYEKKLLEMEHKFRMEEIKAELDSRKEVENLKFDQQMQLQRFRSAAIKNTIDRKQNRSFMEEYPR